jgi:hypothetical protein
LSIIVHLFGFFFVSINNTINPFDPVFLAERRGIVVDPRPLIPSPLPATVCPREKKRKRSFPSFSLRAGLELVHRQSIIRRATTTGSAYRHPLFFVVSRLTLLPRGANNNTLQAIRRHTSQTQSGWNTTCIRSTRPWAPRPKSQRPSC